MCLLLSSFPWQRKARDSLTASGEKANTCSTTGSGWERSSNRQCKNFGHFWFSSAFPYRCAPHSCRDFYAGRRRGSLRIAGVPGTHQKKGGGGRISAFIDLYGIPRITARSNLIHAATADHFQRNFFIQPVASNNQVVLTLPDGSLYKPAEALVYRSIWRNARNIAFTASMAEEAAATWGRGAGPGSTAECGGRALPFYPTAHAAAVTAKMRWVDAPAIAYQIARPPAMRQRLVESAGMGFPITLDCDAGLQRLIVRARTTVTTGAGLALDAWKPLKQQAER